MTEKSMQFVAELVGVCSRFFNEMNEVCSKYQPKSSHKSKNGGKSGHEEKKGDHKPKKKKQPQDPNAPKKPTTNVYLLYCNERRPHLLEERPELKNDPQGLARIAGDEWKSLPQETKKMYREKAAQLKEQYENELAKNNLLPEGEKKGKSKVPSDLIATQSDNEGHKVGTKEEVLKIEDSGKNSDSDSSSFVSSEDESGNENSHSKALASSSEGETDVVEPKVNKKVKKH